MPNTMTSTTEETSNSKMVNPSEFRGSAPLKRNARGRPHFDRDFIKVGRAGNIRRREEGDGLDVVSDRSGRQDAIGPEILQICPLSGGSSHVIRNGRAGRVSNKNRVTRDVLARRIARRIEIIAGLTCRTITDKNYVGHRPRRLHGIQKLLLDEDRARFLRGLGPQTHPRGQEAQDTDNNEGKDTDGQGDFDQRKGRRAERQPGLGLHAPWLPHNVQDFAFSAHSFTDLSCIVTRPVSGRTVSSK